MSGIKDALGDKPYTDLFEHKPQQDLPAAERARDDGLATTQRRNSEWMIQVLAFIKTLPPGWTGIAEDIRLAAPVKAPTSPHAWGSVIRTAIIKGLIAKTGRYLPMKDKTSHARETAEYRRCATSLSP